MTGRDGAVNALARAEQELARGGSVNEVALRLGLRRDQVEGVAAVMRQRAAAAVAGARDNGGAARRLTAPDAKPAAAVRQAGSGDLVEGQLMRVIDSIGELLENERLAGVHRPLAAARGQLVRVRDRVVADRDKERLRVEIAALEAQLKTKRGQLGGRNKVTEQAAGGVEPGVVRAWAAANGVDCPPRGRIPNRVLEVWRQAQGGSDG